MAHLKKRFVEYMFEFVDPIPWPNLYDFERDLANFFSAYGVEAEVSSLMEGYVGRRIVTLTKVEVIDPKGMMTQSDIKPMKDQFKSVLKNIPTGKKK